MKYLKKKFSIILMTVLVLAVVIPALPSFAATQTVAANGGSATITVNNPAKGETYTLYKLFDATVNNGNIAYQSTDALPAGLTDFFTIDTANNVIPADSIAVKDNDGKIIGTNMTDDLKAALDVWAASARKTVDAESNGREALMFTNLPYGYYVITTTHTPDGVDAKAAITVTSTTPNASVYDKNSNVPTVNKMVQKESYSIGDTVEYTATFTTTNYLDEGADSKQVVEFVIEDTIPAFLSDVTVTKITIGGAEYKVDGNVPQFDANNSITIPWATKDETTDPATFTSIYTQGSVIVVNYNGILNSTTNIGIADTNTVTLNANVDDDNGDKQPWTETWSSSAEIFTYAAAIKKTDGANALAGAEFTIKGLVVTGANGVYTVVSYDPTGDAQSDTLITDADGKLYILGLASDVSLVVTETKAPDGFNKLTDTKTLTPQVTSKEIITESGTRYYDADGNLVSATVTGGSSKEVVKNLNDLDAGGLEIVNNKGTELPATGGSGTTILMIIGLAAVLGSGVFLVTNKRIAKEI